MKITLRPVDDGNREAVLAMSPGEERPFVAPNDLSLQEAAETEAKAPGVARPFAIYDDETPVGFCMFAFDPQAADPEDRYYLWRFMIDRACQDKGRGQAALSVIMRYFRDNGADCLYLSTEPENQVGLHVYHKAGFRETGVISDGEAVLMRTLRGPRKRIRTFCGLEPDRRLGIRGKRGYGISMAVFDGEEMNTYCAGSARFGQDFPVDPDTLFQAGSVSKPAFAATVLRYVDRGKIDLDADISGVVSDFVKKGPLTFAALLSHTAGYNLHGFPGYPVAREPLSLEDVLSGRGVTPRLRRIRPYGKQYLYSGGGITLAELAFTRLTGTTLRDAFQQEVAEPLGLVRTGYFQPLDEDKLADAAFGGRLGLREDPAHGYRCFPEHAAAGLWSTPTELCRLGMALSRSYRRGGFLKRKTARRMMAPVLDNYGLCIFRGVRCPELAFHGGWNEGFLTEWNFSLREDLCVAAMINRADGPTDEAHAQVAFDLYQNAKK